MPIDRLSRVRRRSGRRHFHPGGEGAKPVGPRLEDFPGAVCLICQKPASLCVCTGLEQIDNRITLLILQHPQEQDKALGSARLAAAQLGNAFFRVGLSWPSLTKALGPGDDRKRPPEPKRWAVLHLGSIEPAALALPEVARVRGIAAVDGKGHPLADQEGALADIEGIVLFDGTWSHAKTLWWRNPWVLKLRRLVLAPSRPSRYGQLRREPRRAGLSTIEAAGFTLARLERRPEIEAALDESFRQMLAKYREAAGNLKGRNAAPSVP
jgi:DTW domain-containing protein YfiP